MRKFEVRKYCEDVRKSKYFKIEAGCTNDFDVVENVSGGYAYETFDTLEEAQAYISDITSSISDAGLYYNVTEFGIEEWDYSSDDEFEHEYIDHHGYSEMRITVVRKPDYEHIGTFSTLADALDKIEELEEDNEEGYEYFWED